MRTLALLFSLTLVPLALPPAAAETVCVPTSVCVSAGADNGAYLLVCNPRAVGCTISIVAARERTLDAQAFVEGRNDAELDAGADGARAFVQRSQTLNGNVLLAGEAGPAGAFAQFGSNWARANGDGSTASHLCFVANVDGTLVGIACGDWLNGDVTPVFDDGTGDTISDILNDPIVRCLLCNPCLL